MSVSLTSQVWSCAHPKVNGENASRAQSVRFLDSGYNLASNIIRPANDPYSGRPSYLNAANGMNGLSGLGMAGLNPSSWMALETGLRQVEFQSARDGTTFYDTLEGANRSNFMSQKVGSSGGMCGVYNGPTAYENTPLQNNNQGQTLTAPQRQAYMKALYNYY